MIVSSSIIRFCALKFNNKKDERERERRARRASLKIYMKMRRFIKRGGAELGFPLDNGKDKQRYSRLRKTFRKNIVF